LGYVLYITSSIGSIAVLNVSTYQGERMTILGLSDPYILGAYIGCFACVILCIGWALFRKEEGNTDE